MSGTSLPIVSALTTQALCRMPRTLTQASPDVIAVSTSRARPARGGGRPVVAERDGDAGHHARLARRAREPLHPADLERREAAERRARVEIRSAGAVEAAADLGEAQRDRQRREAHQHEPDRRSTRADLRRDLRRHQEDRAADHLIDADRGQIPAAERARSVGAAAAGSERWLSSSESRNH